jgi:hypothetical protein
MKTIRLLFLGLLVLFLVSWGNIGHSIINRKCALSFSPAMVGFNVWADSLSIHASDADTRKSKDSNESPKHFIDIDNYSEFSVNKRIPSTYDSVVAIHGSLFVITNGTLPWATVIAYDSLKQSFKKRQWHKAMLFASDLGHYVADGHMPLHLTPNYDGQFTAQKGIHSRYETTMVSYNQTSLANYLGDSVHLITNVNKYVFDYIYANHHYIDSVLLADKVATTLAGNTNTTVYYQQLWNKTNFTNLLFKNASHALAELIYSAWYEAGSPLFASVINDLESSFLNTIEVFPNPVFDKLTIRGDDVLYLSIYNMEGKNIGVFFTKEIWMTNYKEGVYLLEIYGTNGLIKQVKVLKVN